MPITMSDCRIVELLTVRVLLPIPDGTCCGPLSCRARLRMPCSGPRRPAGSKAAEPVSAGHRLT